MREETGPGMVLVLTVPFKDINGKTIPEIIAYIQNEVACMEEEITRDLIENYFDTERPGLELGPSGIN